MQNQLSVTKVAVVKKVSSLTAQNSFVSSFFTFAAVKNVVQKLLINPRDSIELDTNAFR